MRTRSYSVGDVMELVRRPVVVDPVQIYKEIGIRSFGKGVFHKPPLSGKELGDKRVFYIEPGDLLLSNVFAWEGAVAVAGEAEKGMIGSHRFMTYRVDPHIADTRFLYYLFTSEPGLDVIRRASPGSAGRNRTLGIKTFAAQKIQLPSLNEQRRIAAALDRCITASNATLSRAKSSGLVLEDLTKQVLARFYDRYSSTLAPVASFAEVVRGRGPEYAVDSDVVALNQGCIRWDGIDLSRARKVSPEWEKRLPKTYRIQASDVLVNSTGDGTIGRACVASDRAVGIPFDSHVLAIRSFDGRAIPEFLAFMMRSPQVQESINNAKGANTTKQTELGKRKLEQLFVPVPPLNLQRHALSGLRALMSQIAELEARMNHRYVILTAMPKSFLHAAFTGNL